MPAACPCRRLRAFSLIEALATVAIIGVITFLAIPNIVKMRKDAERNMAVARAEAFNLGVAAYVQSQGLSNAQFEWVGLDPEARYARIRPFLAFAPSRLSDFIVPPYTLRLGEYSISESLTKIPLYEAGREPAIDY